MKSIWSSYNRVFVKSIQADAFYQWFAIHIQWVEWRSINHYIITNLPSKQCAAVNIQWSLITEPPQNTWVCAIGINPNNFLVTIFPCRLTNHGHSPSDTGLPPIILMASGDLLFSGIENHIKWCFTSRFLTCIQTVSGENHRFRQTNWQTFSH